MTNYSNGKIYKIINDKMPNILYYGSTTQPLTYRFSTHKHISNITSSKFLFEYGNPKIILVENYSCNSLYELNERERYYIENNECINNNIPNRSVKEYYHDNKEKIDNYFNEWRQLNKNKLNKKCDCVCGGKYTHKHLSTHIKTKKHQKFITS